MHISTLIYSYIYVYVHLYTICIHSCPTPQNPPATPQRPGRDHKSPTPVGSQELQAGPISVFLVGPKIGMTHIPGSQYESGKRGTSQEQAKRESGKRKHESGKREARVRRKHHESEKRKARVRKKKARVRKKRTTTQEKEKLEIGKRPSVGDSKSRIHKLGLRN